MQNEKCVTSSMVILSEMQRSRRIPCIRSAVPAGFLDFARNDGMMEIIPLGDSALIVRMRERFDDAPEQTLDTVLRAFQQLQNAAIPGVIELAPAYTSVAVFFDPISIAKGAEIPEKVFDWLATRIRRALAGVADPRQNRADTIAKSRNSSLL